MFSTSASTSASTSVSTKVRQEFNRLNLMESGITDDEFADLLAYITKNKNKIPDIEENLKYGTDKVKVKYLRKLLVSDQPDAGNFDSLKRGIVQVVKEEVGREVKKVRYFLEGSMSSQGYSTLSDIGGMAQQGLDIDFPLRLTDITKAKSPGKFSNPPNKDNAVAESEVQEYFISECKALEKFSTLNNKLVVKDTHASPVLGTRKPDFVFVQRDSTTDPLNVVVVGWIEPSLKFTTGEVKLVRSIGMSRTSVVYEGTFNEESVVVKMARKAEYFPCFESERNTLQELSKLESPHIPKVIFHNVNTLVMTPLGEKIHNLQKGDFRDIIKVFGLVHSINYVHRDLRKYNFIRDKSGKIVIIDWGYCIKTNMNHDYTFAGGVEVMPDKVLLSIINEEEIDYGPEVDLVCLVRSFYLMLHRPSLNRAHFDKDDDDIKARAQIILNFWKDCGQSDVWNNIYSAIDNLDYDQLILSLERLF